MKLNNIELVDGIYHTYLPSLPLFRGNEIDVIYFYHPRDAHLLCFRRELKARRGLVYLLHNEVVRRRDELITKNYWFGLGQFEIHLSLNELGLSLYEPPALPAGREMPAPIGQLVDLTLQVRVWVGDQHTQLNGRYKILE